MEIVDKTWVSSSYIAYLLNPHICRQPYGRTYQYQPPSSFHWRPFKHELSTDARAAELIRGYRARHETEDMARSLPRYSFGPADSHSNQQSPSK